MNPVDMQIIGQELAIKWQDQSETFLSLEKVRRYCPCAGCRGEVDVMGNLSKGPDRPLSAQSFQIMRLATVGGYAVQPVWGDGHSSGIYSYEYLQRLESAE